VQVSSQHSAYNMFDGNLACSLVVMAQNMPTVIYATVALTHFSGMMQHWCKSVQSFSALCMLDVYSCSRDICVTILRSLCNLRPLLNLQYNQPPWL
jgi:hypothetical protein